MAAKINDMKKNLEDFEKEVTCALCLEHYTEPKALPCLHYYCKACIVKLALKNNPFPCPDCRKLTKLTMGWEEELPTAHFINRLKDIHAKQEKALRKEVSCEICTKRQVQAEAFCKQCQKFICQRCVESHTLMSAFFEGHEVVSRDKFKDLDQEEVASKNPPGRKCLAHKETLKIYCYQCERVICRDCIVIDHKDHKIEFNNVAAEEKRDDLSISSVLLSLKRQRLGESITRVTKVSAEIKSQGEDLAREIEHSFKEIHTILQQRKTELLKEVEDKVTSKLEVMSKQSENLSITHASIHGMINYIQQCVDHCSDIDIIEMHKELSGRIFNEIDIHEKSKNITLPVEETKMKLKFDLKESISTLCQNNTYIVDGDDSLVSPQTHPISTPQYTPNQPQQGIPLQPTLATPLHFSSITPLQRPSATPLQPQPAK